MRSRFPRAAAAGFAAALLTLGGCSSKGDVSGKVTYAGKTVTSGSVSLIASDKITYAGVINPDGTYSIPGVPTGRAKVLVSSPKVDTNRGKAKRGGGDTDLGASGGGPTTNAADWFPIPDKYADLNNSDLTGEVKGGATTLNLDLK